jgi:long-chain acyl-CoA synthetase
VRVVAGVTTIVGPHIGVGDFVLNFLPLAHILELVFENAIIVWGAAMGYGSPRTLADRAMRNCKGDIQELRPTVLVAVPAVWETVKKGVMDQVSKLPGLKQKMFWGAMALKGTLLHLGLPGVSIIDNIVFKKIKDATGGRMRVCMNGGGPVARETHHFISMAICPMIMGYGLTETAA